MANITPTGLPAWTRTAHFANYGGHAQKRNHLSQGVIDATTDVGAEDFSRMTADLAAVARTAPAWIITYSNNDTSPAAPSIYYVHGMTGVRLSMYAGGSPPTGFPSAARNGTGDVTFTFASSYLDEYGVSGSFQVLRAEASVDAAAAYHAVAQITSPTTVRVRVFNAAGSAQGDQRVTVVIS